MSRRDVPCLNPHELGITVKHTCHECGTEWGSVAHDGDKDKCVMCLKAERDEARAKNAELEERLDWTRQELAGTADTLNATCETHHALESEHSAAMSTIARLTSGAVRVVVSDELTDALYEASHRECNYCEGDVIRVAKVDE